MCAFTCCELPDINKYFCSWNFFLSQHYLDIRLALYLDSTLISVLCYMAVSQKDWEIPNIHEFDWLKSILKAA